MATCWAHGCIQDLEEVEEWNEYGELKDNIGGAPSSNTMSTPSPSASNTPSKPSPPSVDSTTKSSLSSAETLPRPSPSKSSEQPITTAMRQAGFEAAKKAGDAKAKARSKVLDNPDIPKETTEKLDNSGPTGIPPPSGSTDAESAKAPETAESSVEGKADAVPSTQPAVKLPIREKTGPGGAFSAPPETQTMSEGDVMAEEKHEATAEDKKHEPTENTENDGKETERREDSPTVISWKTRDATAATDEAEDLPGTKTQEQDATCGEKAGESVAD